ncbi:MAG: hypothetical protein ACREAM_02875 [Blastocatellia bacterium]
MVQPDSSIPSRLLKAVVAKSFIEIILVCIVATLAAVSTFSPQMRGAIDVANQTRVAGWVYDPRAPEEPLEVQLFIDGKLAATKLADETRVDLIRSGAASEPNHGFNFDLTSINFAPGLAPGRHTAQVYALRLAAGENKILLPIAEQPSVFEVSR